MRIVLLPILCVGLLACAPQPVYQPQPQPVYYQVSPAPVYRAPSEPVYRTVPASEPGRLPGCTHPIPVGGSCTQCSPGDPSVTEQARREYYLKRVREAQVEQAEQRARLRHAER